MHLPCVSARARSGRTSPLAGLARGLGGLPRRPIAETNCWSVTYWRVTVKSASSPPARS